MLAPVKPITSALNARLAKRFAWLLRADLRGTFKEFDSQEFDEWWLIKGRQEYPGWAQDIPADDLKALFESVASIQIANLPFDLPRIVQVLSRLRPDAVKELSHNNLADPEKFLCWTMVRGLSEHHLTSHVPKSLLADLDRAVPKTLGGETPGITLLMWMLWRLMDSSTQQAMNVYEENGRALFFPWFFSVVATLQIEPLIAGRWKSWVKQQSQFNSAQLSWLETKLTKEVPVTTTKESKPWGVNLYGFAYGELGIGEDLRMAVECCEAAKIPYHVVNIDAGNIRQADDWLKGKTTELHDEIMPPYRINIFCLPAFDTVSRVFMQKGAKVFEGYHNIGWWPWELSVFPKAWRPYVFELVDEVWASSKFLYDCYSEATDKAVHHVPLAVSVDRIKRHPRKYYGLPEKKFLFLYIFDFNSSLARKNPMAAIQAFKKAFPKKDKSVGLVLKTMNTNPDNKEWKNFISECEVDPRIQIINKTLDRPDVLGLIDTCDAYVSLHRSEGFGRTVAEAILLDKPVIATSYSGNVDYMTESWHFLVESNLIGIKKGEYQWASLTDKQVWAEVSVDVVADKLIGLAKNNNKPIGHYPNFSPKHVSEIMMQILQS